MLGGSDLLPAELEQRPGCQSRPKRIADSPPVVK